MYKKYFLLILLFLFSCKENECIHLKTKFVTKFDSNDIKDIKVEAYESNTLVFKKKLKILIKGSYNDLNKTNFFLIEDLLCSNYSYKFIISTNNSCKNYFLNNIMVRERNLGSFVINEVYSYSLNNKVYYRSIIYFN